MKDEENKGGMESGTSEKGCHCSSEKDSGKNAEEKKECSDNSSEIEERVFGLESENRNLKDALLRKMAEFDNLRKRLEKEKDEAVKYANLKFVKDLLTVSDNFDRVTESSNSIDENLKNDEKLRAFFEGIGICGRELLSVFRKHGISRLEVESGCLFDPKHHQAICEVEAEGARPGAVVGVFQAGYMYHDRLLRPSTVSVARKQ